MEVDKLALGGRARNVKGYVADPRSSWGRNQRIIFVFGYNIPILKVRVYLEDSSISGSDLEAIEESFKKIESPGIKIDKPVEFKRVRF